MHDTNYSQIMKTASAEAINAWNQIGHNPRVLFDAFSAEWNLLTVHDKLEALRCFQRYHLLDKILKVYITSYRQHNVHVLDGLGSAVVEYAENGYCLRLPASPMIGGIFHPGFVASMARVMEDNQLECSQYHWLVWEMHRLRTAVAEWLRIHEGPNAKVYPPFPDHKEQDDGE